MPHEAGDASQQRGPREEQSGGRLQDCGRRKPRRQGQADEARDGEGEVEGHGESCADLARQPEHGRRVRERPRRHRGLARLHDDEEDQASREDAPWHACGSRGARASTVEGLDAPDLHLPVSGLAAASAFASYHGRKRKVDGHQQVPSLLRHHDADEWSQHGPNAVEDLVDVEWQAAALSENARDQRVLRGVQHRHGKAKNEER
mmetsp:Transcript_2761/g.6446  ORF Transcript_2761/g.6446 Transcript_2761/m.6446 type:complete len:204 (-) Transcript_2761:366-977(-)